MESRTMPASMDYLEESMTALDRFLCEEGCPEEDRYRIGISAEELFTNIASYAYGPLGGMLKLEYEVRAADQTGAKQEERLAWIRFTDQGIAFDPFSGKEPDIHLPVEERPVGGLGIYMVKHLMDQVCYRRQGNCNVTTITRQFRREEQPSL